MISDPSLNSQEFEFYSESEGGNRPQPPSRWQRWFQKAQRFGNVLRIINLVKTPLPVDAIPLPDHRPAIVRQVDVAAGSPPNKEMAELEGFGEFEAELALLGHVAARAESEQECTAHAAAMAPLVVRQQQLSPAVTARLAPRLARVAGLLQRQPLTRPLLRTLPTIAQDTARLLAGRIRHGQPLTRNSVGHAFARSCHQVWNSAPATRRAMFATLPRNPLA